MAAFLASKMSPSFFDFSALTLAKYLSLMFSGTDTLDTSSLVEVATKYLWFTLLSGQPLSLWGPVTSCLRTTTRLPLWTPARTMATVPGVREALTFLTWPEKKFSEVPAAGASTVGTLLVNFLTRTMRVSPFLAPPTFFSTNTTAFLGAAFLFTFLVNL